MEPAILVIVISVMYLLMGAEKEEEREHLVTRMTTSQASWLSRICKHIDRLEAKQGSGHVTTESHKQDTPLS